MTKPTKQYVRPAKTHQPGHPLSGKLRAQDFFKRTAKTLINWADAQADLSLHWVHSSFYWFCHAAAHMCH